MSTTPPPKSLQILFLEDDPLDLELAIIKLEEHGYEPEWVQVETREAFLTALEDTRFDLVLADYNLPTFDGLTALQLFVEREKAIPFILVSGTLGEDVAIESLKAGATDYVMKNRLSRLGPAVERALREVREQRQRQQAEVRLRENERRLNTLMGNLPGMAYRCKNGPDWPMEFVSQGSFDLTGHKPHELMLGGDVSYGEVIHPADREKVWESVQESIQKGQAFKIEYRIITKQGVEKWVWEQGLAVHKVSEDQFILEGFITDITERKQALQKLNLERETLSLFNDLNQAANRGDPLQEIIHLFIEQLGNIFHYSTATVYLLDQEKQSLIMQNLSLPPGLTRQIEDILGRGIPEVRIKLREGGIYTEILQAHEPVLIKDPAQIRQMMEECTENTAFQALVPAIHRLLPYKSVMSIPLFDHQETIGLLDVSSRVPLSKSDLDRLQAITEQFTAILKRKRAEDALRESEERHRLLFDSASQGIGYFDLEGNVIAYNNLAAARMGGQPEDFVGKSLFELSGEEEGQKYLGRIQRAAETEENQDYEDLISLPVGERWYLSTYTRIRDARGQVVGVQIISTDITERKEAEQKIQQYVRRMEALLEIDRAITSTLDVEEILDIIMAELNKVISYDSISLQMLYENHLEIIGCQGFPAGEDVQGLVFPLEPKFPNYRVIKEKDILALDDVVQSYPHFDQENRRYHSGAIRSWLGMPLISKGRVLGMIALDRTEVKPFSEAEIEIANAFAGQAALAIENARLLQDAQTRAEELTSLNEISAILRTADSFEEALPPLLNKALSAVNAQAGSINLYQPETETLAAYAVRGWFEKLQKDPLQPDQGIGGKVFTTGEPHISDEFISDPATRTPVNPVIPKAWGGACLPIKTDQQIIGVFYLAKPTHQPLTQSQISLLKAIAEMTGVALHRLRLHEETTQRLEQLQALHSVNQSITGSFDVGITLDMLVNHVRDQLKADAAGVLLYDPYLQELTYAAGVGFTTGEYEQTTIRLGKGYAGQAVLEQRMVHESDLTSPEDGMTHTEFITREGFQAYWGVPLIAKGKTLGVLEVFRRQSGEADALWLDFLNTLASQAAIAIADTQLFTDLQRANQDLRLAYEATIEGWARAIELHDKTTEDHSRRVVEMTIRLAQAMNVSSEKFPHIRRGTLLHDIGKMAIPDDILLKPGKLSPEEWAVMHQHPQFAFDMLKEIEYLHPALDIPHCHHEKWDGSGYPRGLEGEQIPLPARIFAVIDVYDALTSKRPYREAWSEEEALAYIREQRGKHFDPRVVDTFFEVIVQ